MRESHPDPQWWAGNRAVVSSRLGLGLFLITVSPACTPANHRCPQLPLSYCSPSTTALSRLEVLFSSRFF